MRPFVCSEGGLQTVELAWPGTYSRTGAQPVRPRRRTRPAVQAGKFTTKAPGTVPRSTAIQPPSPAPARPRSTGPQDSQYDTRVKFVRELATETLPYALLLVTGGFVLGILLAMDLPAFSLSERMSRH